MGTMGRRWLFLGLLISSIFSAVSAIDCLCDDEGFFSVTNILFLQKVGDVLIAIAYFSIPLELLYFISCSNIPFKWVLLQFIAFIVLCGLTHLLNVWTINSHPSFQIIMSLTVAKILTALVSCATAITLLTLLPLLLKFKVRELFLRQNVLELDQEVGMLMKQNEASVHVRMLTQEIRKSLDKHNILYTTLVELSKTLNLQNCVVWMPSENRKEMNLTHELNPNPNPNSSCRCLSINDPDVLEITKNEGVRILKRDSVLADSCGGPIAAIRMPLLRGSNFKGGTPELVDTCFAVLVLVLPPGDENGRDWSCDELEIVEVVADQVAVALSHAAVLEESQLMRDRLKERNHLLVQAKEDAVKASKARSAFQKVMNNGMRRPMHSILGLLSILQDRTNNNLKPEERIVIDTCVQTSTVLSMLISDAMEISAKDDGIFPVEMRPFQLHSLVQKACCLVKCFAFCKGFGFSTDVSSSLPNQVMGDENRTFQVILHMVGHLFNKSDGNCMVVFRVGPESESGDGNNNKVRNARIASSGDENLAVKFEIEITVEGSGIHPGRRKHNSRDVKESLSFSMCRKLVQLMQGNIWISSNSRGRAQGMILILRFQKQSSYRRRVFEYKNPSIEQQISSSTFKDLKVLLADDDGVNRMVTKKLLEMLGCHVTAVSTGFECLSALGGPTGRTSFQIIVLDLHMPEMDGFEVVKRVRQYRSRNWPLIIALTASSEDHMWDKCLQVGMNGLIRKPVILQKLADELQRVLLRAREAM
ncbi:unnamed protein product [Cuscuta epithymum]|uniref:Ethylene receptor n=1 Tax=Cuscuta epithymum TaxID=186058 RepID=A0AAV0D7B4_9ASTE|nr:unnamed protein product [Cuscuta epithymum]